MKRKEFNLATNCILGIVLYELGFLSIACWKLMDSMPMLLVGICNILIGVVLFVGFPHIHYRIPKNLGQMLRFQKHSNIRAA